MNQRDSDHSPVGSREARYVFNVAGSWKHAEDDATNGEWARAAWGDMEAFSTGGTYINFPTEDEGEERMDAAFGKSLTRLTEIKRVWDPDNVFRTNRNIEPG